MDADKIDADKIVVNKLKDHSRLSGDDIAEIKDFGFSPRELADQEDLIRQGDEPDRSVVVISGWVARYHLLRGGGRQYLSFHMAGDWPDAQALFLDRMDHAVCAIGPALVAGILHKELTRAITRRPALGFAIWRETLIDASIFREAITNNSARSKPARMAHLFCELFYRARALGHVHDDQLHLPLSLMQLGEALGMAIATVNRTLVELRASRAADFRSGTLTVHNWPRLCAIGEFDPGYLHLKKQPR
ncbi:putative transcriptional regulator, Crp/Fnr family [Bradyrhizobium sp. ORS 285]|uniref:Crp/Fnr family transcriptional regulator n=1 Tax=Bradyrhizobium sp. ORS 285 TaxID=115808 RepID=UPI0002406252|nr:putative transcriptional regulator, Crp/Fnr family [Bradyrhizobium sp. ORS 285]SMX56857.1 putative transcriptional regulator, Crp/Fnr family [Bradyrhizobium sp. ORS 285]